MSRPVRNLILTILTALILGSLMTVRPAAQGAQPITREETPYRGSSDRLTLVERFTPLGPDTVAGK